MRKPKTGILTLLALSLVALFSVGCGSSESFVFTGPVTNPPAPGTTGNLQFRFNTFNAQTAANLPEGTAQLFFSLHTGNPPSNANLNAAIGPVAVSSLNADGTYVLEGVDPEVNTVVVVATTAEGFPLAAWQATGIEVILGETVPVDLGDADPIEFTGLSVSPELVRVEKDGEPVQLVLTLSFNNGTQITLPSFDAPEVSFDQTTTVANITTTGLVSTGVGGQNTSATVTYDLLGATQQAPFEIQTFCFDILSVDDEIGPDETGGDDSDVSFRFVGPNGVVIQDGQDNPNLSWALAAQIPGVSIDADGNLSTDNVNVGTLIDVVLTYSDPVTGETFNRTYTVEVVEDLD